MTKNIEMDVLADVSAEAVQKATGKTWKEWIDFLDKHQARDKSHKDIIALLSDRIESNWWCQKIASGYAQWLGKKVKGQTEAAGFEVGLRRTFPVSAVKAWELITSDKGVETWLGRSRNIKSNQPQQYTTYEGIRGEILVFKELSHIRLSWQPEYWDHSSTVQIRVIDAGEKSTIAIHQEGLRDMQERVDMKAHWTKVMELLLELISHS